jgi:hypothetical protein
VPESRKSRNTVNGPIDFSPDFFLPCGDHEDEEIDLINTSNEDVNISGWVLRDKNNHSTSYTFPGGTVLAPDGDFVEVWTAPGYTHTFNRQTPVWDDCGAALEVLDSTGTVRATRAYGNHLIP